MLLTNSHSSQWIFILPLIAVVLAACVSSATVRIEADGEGGVKGTVEIEFENETNSVSANSVFQTREVDPNVFTNDPNYTHSGIVTLTLENGSTVSHSQNLYYDSGTSVAPITSGHVALAYRPVNPSALQSFLDQYWSQTVSATVTAVVRLRDISDGTVSSTTVDVQASANAQTEYIGSSSVTPPSTTRLQQDL